MKALEVTGHTMRKGERGIHERFIIGATRAFPRYKFDDLFYITSEKSQNEGK